MGLFNIFSKKEHKEDLDKGLEKTKEGVFSKLARAVAGRSTIDTQVLDDLEEVLITSDVGVETTVKIIERIEARVARDKYMNTSELQSILRDEIAQLMEESHRSTENFGLDVEEGVPYVIMVVGVNGAGKTTTIGKLAAQLTRAGLNVYIGAADTFRAAAIDQLAVWAERAGATMIRQEMGSDPASVAFDTLKSAVANKADVVLIDTAGRLHNKANLMQELAKLRKIIDRETPDAAKETLLVLDAKTPRENLNFTGYTCLEYDILYRGYTGLLDVGSSVIFDNIGSYSNVLKPPFIHPDVPMIEYRKSDDSLRLIKRAQMAEEIFAQYVFEE